MQRVVGAVLTLLDSGVARSALHASCSVSTPCAGCGAEMATVSPIAVSPVVARAFCRALWVPAVAFGGAFAAASIVACQRRLLSNRLRAPGRRTLAFRIHQNPRAQFARDARGFDRRRHAVTS